MWWVLKNEDGEYLSEVDRTTLWFDDEQRHAKRFNNPLSAYRVALKWGDMKVVRIKPKAAPVTAAEVPGPRPDAPPKGDSSWDGDCG